MKNLHLLFLEYKIELMIMKSPLHVKSYNFAKKIVRIAQYLNKRQEFILSNQLLKSGTAICALIRESQFAESKADFIHKLHIALKEANETDFWVSLLRDCQVIPADLEYKLESDCNELISMLVASVKTLKSHNPI